MATVTITIPDPVLDRVLDAFAATYNWDGQGTKAAFARQKVAEYVKQVVKGYEAQRDSEAARTAAASKADSEVTIS